MDEETKTALKKINDYWAEMKTHINAQQDEIKRLTGGVPSGETKATIERLETAIQAQEDEMKTLRATAQRPSRGDAGGEEDYDRTRYNSAEHKHLSGIFWDSLAKGVERISDEQKSVFEKKFNTQRLMHGDPAERRSLSVRYDAEMKALAVGDETAGGYLAPPEFVQDIVKGVQLISPIRPLAQVKTTARRSVQYPVRSGVFAARWVSETGQRAETAGLKYALEEIPNHEMYADVLVSDQDLEDSVFNLEQEILDNCTEQFAKAEGSAFVNGTGVGQPEGILTNGSIGADTFTMAATGANAHVLGPQAFLTIWTNIKTVYAKQATWLLNRGAIGQARSMVDGQGRFLWEPGLADGTPPGILGSPYIEVPDMPNVPSSSGSAACIVYGNIKRGYLIVDRINVVVRRLQEKYAESGQVAYLVRKRVGGQVVLPEAIRKMTVTFA